MKTTKHGLAHAWPSILIVSALPSQIACVAPTQTARFETFSLAVPSTIAKTDEDNPTALFLEHKTLRREALIVEVLRRNPSIETAQLAFKEALAQYSQTIAFADPRLTYEFAPESISSKHGYGQSIGIKQSLEWPGKQALRGAIVLADVAAKQQDIKTIRIQLATTASMLFDDYFVVRRRLEIYQEHAKLVKRIQQSAEAQYAAGRGSQQDPIQAEVELAVLEHERIVQESRRKIITAQINGLLRRSPTSPLPPAPANLSPALVPKNNNEKWQQIAKQERPELQNMRHKVEASELRVKLSNKDDMPDFSVGATYNSMWPETEHQFMLGFSLNLPFLFEKRHSAKAQAKAALARAQSKHEEKRREVQVQVRQAWIRLLESIDHTTLFRERILPAARRHVEAAEAGYESGRGNFSNIMSSQRRLRTFEREEAEALANTWRSQAQFIRALGSGITPNGESK